MPALAALSGSLYLAAAVEKLYGRFPHLYSDIAEDSLPACVRDRD